MKKRELFAKLWLGKGGMVSVVSTSDISYRHSLVHGGELGRSINDE